MLTHSDVTGQLGKLGVAEEFIQGENDPGLGAITIQACLKETMFLVRITFLWPLGPLWTAVSLAPRAAFACLFSWPF